MGSAFRPSQFQMTSAVVPLPATPRITSEFSGGSRQRTRVCASFGYATVRRLQLAPAVPLRPAEAGAMNLQTSRATLGRASAALLRQHALGHKSTIQRHSRLLAQRQCPSAASTTAWRLLLPHSRRRPLQQCSSPRDCARSTSMRYADSFSGASPAPTNAGQAAVNTDIQYRRQPRSPGCYRALARQRRDRHRPRDPCPHRLHLLIHCST